MDMMSITVDSKRYMAFDDLYRIQEYEENAVVFVVDVDDKYSDYTFRMELENREANRKDMVYVDENNTFTVPVDMLKRGLLKFQGVFLTTRVITGENGRVETIEKVVAKTNRIMTTVLPSVNAEGFVVNEYPNIIEDFRNKLFADVEQQDDDLVFYNTKGEVLKTIGLSLGGISHTVIEDLQEGA